MRDKARVNHLIGIIPIASPENYFNMPWHDCLMPLKDDYLAIEHAVFTCALAGCESIWIVGHINLQPLVRKRVGESIIDPLTYFSTDSFEYTRHDKFDTKKEIQIYYFPIHSRDRNKKDSLGYSVLYAANNIIKIHEQFSKWAMPDKIFCCFPYGIVSQQSIYELRKYKSKFDNTVMNFDNKNIKNGVMLPFTFSLADLQRCTKSLLHYSINIWENSDRFEKPSVMHFSLEEVFSNLDFSTNYMVNADWYHQIDSWEKYRQFIISDEYHKIKRYEQLYPAFSKRKPLIFEEKNDI